MLAGLGSLIRLGALAIPGSNYAMIAFDLVRRYWKPIVIALALAYSFHAGVKHERKKHDTAQFKAQIEKLTFERDNLKVAGDLANSQITELQQRVDSNENLVQEIRERPPAGDCALTPDAMRRLRAIGD